MAVSMFQGMTYPGTAETLNGCTPSFSNGIYTLTSCAGTKDNNNLELPRGQTTSTRLTLRSY